MFALTVDQVDSRHRADLVATVEADRGRLRAAGAVLGPDRTAGDEFQMLFVDATAALRAGLDLLRPGTWTVGLGVGPVEEPLPGTTREATGPAFTAARTAIEAAKGSPSRFAVACEGDPRGAGDLTALVRVLLEVRARRSAEGWEVADLSATGATQASIAERLGITAQAVSLRAKAAALRIDQDAVPALERLLADLDDDERRGS